MIGRSYLNEIYVTHVTGQFCQGITLTYTDYDQFITNEYYFMMNKIYIKVIGNGSKCYKFNDYFNAGVQLIGSAHTKNTKIIVSNSTFYRLHGTAMYITSDCGLSRNTILIHNCTFDSITAIMEPVVHVALFQHNNFISFNNCTFKRNYAEDSVVAILIKDVQAVFCRYHQNLGTQSSAYFRENHFKLNYGKLLYLKGLYYIRNITLYVTGPGKTGLIYTNTLVYIIVRIFCSVCAIHNLLILLNSSWSFAYMMTF